MLRVAANGAYTGSGGSCRLCRAYCDWVVDPAGCVEQECPNLYAYDDVEGRRVIGCMERVFAPELDREALDRARGETRGRLGGLRAIRRPLPICRSAVERAYPARLPAAGCINPEFAEPVDGEAFRVTLAPGAEP